MNNNYLLQINLEDVVRSSKDPKEISEWLFVTYCDIFNAELISENQIINLIRKISDKRSKIIPQGTMKNIKYQLFEPDISRKEEEKEFYKSNQNFYSADKDNISVVDQSVKEKIPSDDVNGEGKNSVKVNRYSKHKDNLIPINLTKIPTNRNVDYDENYYSNDLSIESLNSY
jgi:hypothetical protein